MGDGHGVGRNVSGVACRKSSVTIRSRSPVGVTGPASAVRDWVQGDALPVRDCAADQQRAGSREVDGGGARFDHYIGCAGVYRISMINARDFRGACYAAARGVGGGIIEIRVANSVMPNFHEGIFDYRGRRVSVTCTRDSAAVLTVSEPRIIDFVRGSLDGSPLVFLDAPELASAVASFLPGVQVLPASELNGPFKPEAWPHVNADDIKYWRPGTLGEALFNYWD